MSGNVKPFTEREQKFMIRHFNKNESYSQIADGLNAEYPEDGDKARSRVGVLGWLTTYRNEIHEIPIHIPKYTFDHIPDARLDSIDIDFACSRAIQELIDHRLNIESPGPLKIKPPATLKLNRKTSKEE
jgi:hypothetical protein